MVQAIRARLPLRGRLNVLFIPIGLAVAASPFGFKTLQNLGILIHLMVADMLVLRVRFFRTS